MPSIINATTTNGVAVSGDNSGALALQTNNGTTAVTISTGQNVGIGTTSPTNPIQTYKLGELSSSSNNIRNLAYFQADTTVANSSIIFNTNPSAGQNLRGFRFGYQSSEFSITRFHTDKTTGVVNDLTVDSSGNVGIGTATIGAALTVSKSNSYAGGLLLGQAAVASGYISTTDNLYIKPNTSGNTASGSVFIQNFAGSSNQISLSAVSGSIAIGGATVAATGAGITFPATQSASTDANTLDDYEEGSWTPTDISGAGLSLSVVAATYVKVGRMVTVQGYVNFPSTSSTALTNIGGLPFTVDPTNQYFYGPCRIGATNLLVAVQLNSSSNGFFIYLNGSATAVNSQFSASYFLFSATYISSS